MLLTIHIFDLFLIAAVRLNVMTRRGSSFVLAVVVSLVVSSFAARVDVSDSSSIAELNDPDIDFVEEIPLLSNETIVKVMNWIKAETTMVKNPFCWKRSYGRGVGEVLSECPSDRTRIGALCYSHCPSGMKRFGFDCHSVCPSGFRDDGLYCRLAEYGRGVGYPWTFRDGWSSGGMYSRCEHDHGKGNCEKWGLIVYPKCKSGYHNFGCCICRPERPNCEELGLGHQLDLFCAKKIKIGDPTPLICKSNLEKDGALCYNKCDQNFTGVGPVCWGHCDNSQVNCGAACAKTSNDCAFSVAGQIVAPLVLAANIASFGLAAPATGSTTAGVNALKVGGKVMTSSSILGKALIRAVKSFEAVQKNTVVVKVVKVARKLKDFATGELVQSTVKSIKVGKEAYEAETQYRTAYAQEFAEQTSQEISDELDKHFIPLTSNYLKGLWGEIQLQEMATANDWQMGQNVLDVGSVVDISGVTGVIAAYAKPICGDIVTFPII